MLTPLVNAPLALDASTLIVLACGATVVLGSLLLFMGNRDRMRTLAWWGSGYLLGGFSVALWSFEGSEGEYLPAGIPNALLFIACGMMWNAARLSRGRRIEWLAMIAGAAVWLLAVDTGFAGSAAQRMTLSAAIIAAYMGLTAYELWRERRRARLQRRLAIIVPALHGTVFLLPMLLASLLPEGGAGFSTSFVAIFGLEALLYAIGAAFIVPVLTLDEKVQVHRTAALTDPLTGILNRSGFLDNAAALLALQAKRRAPITVLLFDLDRFKSINERFGHATGDEALRLFAATAGRAMRSNDIFGRVGGEEFAAILAGSADDGAVVGERVRFAFELCAVAIEEHDIEGTVSIGVASGRPPRRADLAYVEMLLARADAAMHRAKEKGRNRLEIADAAPVESGATSLWSKHLGGREAVSSIA